MDCTLVTDAVLLLAPSPTKASGVPSDGALRFRSVDNAFVCDCCNVDDVDYRVPEDQQSESIGRENKPDLLGAAGHDGTNVFPAVALAFELLRGTESHVSNGDVPVRVRSCAVRHVILTWSLFRQFLL